MLYNGKEHVAPYRCHEDTGCKNHRQRERACWFGCATAAMPRRGQDSLCIKRLYAPVIYGFARKRGLQDADAADLMQDVLRSVSSAVHRLEYDPVRGTFRGWLFTVTRNKVFNFLESRSRRVQGSGDSGMQQRLEQHADADEDQSADWEADYQRALAAQAMERVKGEFQTATWEAFLQTSGFSMEGRTPPQK